MILGLIAMGLDPSCLWPLNHFLLVVRPGSVQRCFECSVPGVGKIHLRNFLLQLFASFTSFPESTPNMNVLKKIDE